LLTSTTTMPPTTTTGKFAWKLIETRDPFDNRILYTYAADEGQEGPHTWRQPLLSRIDYADFIEGEATRFLISVSFTYEDRPDPFSDYRAGFEIRTTQRCTAITVETHADRTRQVRTYAFTYDNSAANGVSQLTQIEVIGYDDAGQPVQELPPLTFGYTVFDPFHAEKRDLVPVTGPDLPPGNLGRPEYELADLTGDGLPDVLEMNGVVRYWRNLGNGRFDLPRPMRDAPAGLTLADPEVQLIDADGDGRIDLLVNQNGLSGYYPLQFTGEWDRRSFRRCRHAPSFSLEDPEVKLVDLSGDGVTDAMRSGSRLECFFNDPQEGWNGTRWVERQTLEEFPDINFSDPRVKWGDMSGDGLQDIVLVYDGNVEYWPNLGRGDWGPRIHMRDSPRFPYGYDPRRILAGDVDGDGLADLVYVDDRQVTLWINQSGNGWSDPIIIQGTPPVTDMDAVRLVDMLGSGIGGVLWSADTGDLARHPMHFLDLTGGVKPYLLNEMDNHLGAVTKVEYAPSTRFYLGDQKKLQTHWKTPLPFPVQVVARVEVIDELSHGKLTTEYTYHHGYWDGAEREYRGFGRVEQRDTETFDKYGQAGLHGDAPFEPVPQRHFSPPTLTKTWFHLGPVGEEFGEWEEQDWSAEYWQGDRQVLRHTEAVNAFLRGIRDRRVKRDALRTLRGSILRTELYALDGSERAGRPYTVTEHAYGLREEESPGADEERLHIFFSHVVAQRTTQWERGDQPMSQFTFTDTEDYDPYGQVLCQTQIACPRGWRGLADTPGEPFLATQNRIDYARPVDPDVYLMDRVARTTSYEIKNSGELPLLVLKDAPPTLEIIGQTVNYYDGDAFVGLPYGHIGDYGALVRSETLVLTEEILRQAYDSGDIGLQEPELPSYLVPDVLPLPWTGDYPQPFREQCELMRGLAGYTFYPGDDQQHARGYFANTTRRRYDFQAAGGRGRGLVVATRDPLGGDAPENSERDTVIAYDAFALLPVSVTDPAGLTTHAAYDYRVFQPNLVTDPNGNRMVFTFTELGLLASTAVMGKEGEEVGDTMVRPGTRLEYDFLAYQSSPPEDRQPIWVRTIRREHHAYDTDVPLPERDGTIETVEYSDGFGRLLQTRTQAEDVTFGDLAFGNELLPADQALAPGDAVGRPRDQDDPPNVVVSGWQIYDNKGRVVVKYEPFFDTGWAYDPPADDKLGQKVTMFYDPRGQVIRTVNPDGSEQRVIYGVPPDLTDPDHFTPMPWEVFTYDANDNAGRTHPGQARAYEHCWDTPTSIVLDGLGRTVRSIERSRAPRPQPEDPLPDPEEYETRFTYDIRGNPLTVTDALGRPAFSYVYDLADNPLRVQNIDAGIRRTIQDAAGNEIERRDSKGALILRAYDGLNRPIRLWARDDEDSPVTPTLREWLVYGDGGDPAQPAVERAANRAANRLSRLYQHYDEAGLLTLAAYDFKGNVLEKSRQVISDDAILSVFVPLHPDWRVPAYRVDWQPEGTTLTEQAAALLDPTPYETSLTYDALNRIRTMRYPQDVDGGRRELRSHYNRAGALEWVELGATSYVEHIAYNAKGQRTLIAYGNGVLSRYAYDPHTFRLARLRSERYQVTGDFSYHPAGAVLQDFAFGYDLAGNILALHDRTPGSGIPNTPDSLDREFTYDAIYRLFSATGRACVGEPPGFPWADAPKSQDVTLTRGYTETYTYDQVGNMIQMRHTADTPGNVGGFSRDFALRPGTNQLQRMTIGDNPNSPFDYTYDRNGNLIRETTSRHFEWDHSDRMRVFRNQPEGAPPSVHTHYLYDASGQRVKKLMRRQGGGFETTTYVDGIFVHHRWQGNGVGTGENNRLHVMDNQQRIGLVRVGAPHPDDRGPAIQYHLGDHLGSSNVVVDDTGTWTNREEFFPYGETSFGSFARKRYRFTGKERDEESGLYYYGARYYAPWLARWITTDPAYWLIQPRPSVGVQRTDTPDERQISAEHCAFDLYVAVRNNPINYTDSDGRVSKKLIRVISQLLNLLSNEPTAVQEIPQPGPTIPEPPPPPPSPPPPPPSPPSRSGSTRTSSWRTASPGQIRGPKIPREPPRESLSRGFPRRLQALLRSGRGGTATVGGMIRASAGTILFEYLAEKGYEILMGGLGLDLEARQRYGFHLSQEQQQELEQLQREPWAARFKERHAQQLAEREGITVEEARERLEAVRSSGPRHRQWTAPDE
jgi:RHS repeat-associated protein